MRCKFSSRVSFRERHFPDVGDDEWNDWRWQRKNSLKNLEDFRRLLHLSEGERSALSSVIEGLPTLVTPYYAGLLDPHDPEHPLRRTVVPTVAERVHSPGERNDPLSEEDYSPAPHIVHRYADRVLFLVSDHCAVYCRYCTRSRRVGRGQTGEPAIEDRPASGIEYIRANHEIREVLLSGGDPLILDDGVLDKLLTDLREIEHVEIIRVGTKAPVVLPQRVTPSLVRVLKKHQPLWMSLHCTHPAELTGEVRRAFEMLADAGIPLQSQTVLLRGINDEVSTLKELFHGLLRLRVRPYYLFQCDPVEGSEHFRVPVKRGLEIMANLRRSTSGMAVPVYAIDPPGDGGKIPIMGGCLTARGESLVLVNERGEESGPYHDDATLSFSLKRRKT